jgi:hypothetical protein
LIEPLDAVLPERGIDLPRVNALPLQLTVDQHTMERTTQEGERRCHVYDAADDGGALPLRAGLDESLAHALMSRASRMRTPSHRLDETLAFCDQLLAGLDDMRLGEAIGLSIASKPPSIFG